MKLFLDTNSYCAFKRGDSESIFIIERAPVIVMSTIVIGELRSGFICGGKSQKNEIELDRFLKSPRVYVRPISEEVTSVYARTFKQLRLDGRPIPTNDMWIAAVALQDGGVLYSLDEHFHFVNGLTVINSKRVFLQL